MAQPQAPGIPLGAEANPLTSKYPPGYCYFPTYEFDQNVAFDVFDYVFPTFTTLAAAASAQQQVLIQNDSDFECRRISWYATIANAAFVSAAIPVPSVTAVLTDSGSGRNLENNPVPLVMIGYGPLQQPFDLAWPKIFTRNSSITLTLTNFDAAASYNIRVTLHGRKIFPLGG
jgi:hypothetical protein